MRHYAKFGFCGKNIAIATNDFGEIGKFTEIIYIAIATKLNGNFALALKTSVAIAMLTLQLQLQY